MALNKTLKLDKTGGVEIPKGTQIGLLRDIVHLGLQRSDYQGVKSIKDQVFFRFELQDVLSATGTPATTFKIVTNSMKAKATMLKIGKALGADVSEGMDFDKLVGSALLLEMGDNDAKTKIVIKEFTQLPAILKKAVKPLMGTPTIHLDVDSITDAQLSELPEWVRKIISERVRDDAHLTVDDSDSVDL